MSLLTRKPKPKDRIEEEFLSIKAQVIHLLTQINQALDNLPRYIKEVKKNKA